MQRNAQINKIFFQVLLYDFFMSENNNNIEWSCCVLKMYVGK